jgi:hypothetical protein
MALIVSAASGNFNAGATWVGGVVPGVGDEARASTGHTVTITENSTCNLINNAGTGTFILNDGVTLTSNIEKGNTSTPSVQLTGSNSANIVGNVTGPFSGPASTHSVITKSSSGTLSITGNITGGSAGASGPVAITNAAGTLNITGNVTAGTGGNSVGVFAHGITLTGGSVVVTGNVSGNNSGTQTGNKGIDSSSAVTISVVGNVTAGTLANSPAISSISALSTVIVQGQITASNLNSAIVATASGTHQFSGSFIHSENGTIPISCTRYRLGTTPTAAKTRYALNGSGTYVDMFTADNTGLAPAVKDVRAGVVYGSATGTCAVPAAGSVALGVPVDATTGTAVLTPEAVWGHASRTITGGLVDTATTLTNAPTVPSVVQIRQEMDSNSTKLANLDTTISSRLAPSGTLATVTNLTNAPASVTPSDIWSHASRTITGGTVDTLTNAPTVPTPSQIASQVRTELSTELARVDQAISSRLAGSAYTAPANSDVAAIKAKTDNLPASPAATGDIPSANISAIKAKTDLLNTDRLAQCSTVSTNGAQLAAALS